jgi:hypothetical protein
MLTTTFRALRWAALPGEVGETDDCYDATAYDEI